MKTYNVPVEIEFMPAFEKACKRVGIMDIKVTSCLHDFNMVDVITSHPETLFALGNQYSFYRTMQVHNHTIANNIISTIK